mgnify:FL=1
MENGTSEIVSFRITKEQIDEFVDETPKEHDLAQASLPLKYTSELVSSRLYMLDKLGAALREHLSDFLKGKTVLEVGPGIEDILFKMLFQNMLI